MKLMMWIAMHTALISFAVYEKADRIRKKITLLQVTKYEAIVVPRGSRGYLTTRHSLAQRSPVYPENDICIIILPSVCSKGTHWSASL